MAVFYIILIVRGIRLKKNRISTGQLIFLFFIFHIAAVGYAVKFLHPYYGSNDEFTLAAIASGHMEVIRSILFICTVHLDGY